MIALALVWLPEEIFSSCRNDVIFVTLTAIIWVGGCVHTQETFPIKKKRELN